jgi:hypothetical protein
MTAYAPVIALDLVDRYPHAASVLGGVLYPSASRITCVKSRITLALDSRSSRSAGIHTSRK